MRRLIYASRWTAAVRDDPHHVLQQVVCRSMARNRLQDVTGFLISHNGVFLQALEGPDAQVEDIFRKIVGDHRHTDVMVLTDSPAEARAFRGWSMAGAQCWDEAIGAEIATADRNGFGGVTAARWLEILQSVAAVDYGRLPLSAAA